MESIHRKLGVFSEKFKRVSGIPPFSSYIADRAFKILIDTKKSKGSQIRLWDPHCGEAVLTRTISYIYKNIIKQIIVSDINYDCVKTALHNLEIVSGEGGVVNIFGFNQNVLEGDFPIGDDSIDVFYTDPPYEYMERYYEESNNAYLNRMLLNIRSKLRDSSSIGLILDRFGYEEELGDITYGYSFLEAKLIDPRYKRVLYLLKTKK